MRLHDIVPFAMEFFRIEIDLIHSSAVTFRPVGYLRRTPHRHSCSTPLAFQERGRLKRACSITRWMVFPQDFPSANFLVAHGIRQALLVQKDRAEPQDDLAHSLLRWQEGGIKVLPKKLDDNSPPSEITVKRPSKYKATWYRALAQLGLRRNGAGGFGSYFAEVSASQNRETLGVCSLAGDSVIPLSIYSGPSTYGYIYQASYYVYANPGGQKVTTAQGVSTYENVTQTSANYTYTPTLGQGSLNANSQVVDTPLGLVSNAPLPSNLRRCK